MDLAKGRPAPRVLVAVALVVGVVAACSASGTPSAGGPTAEAGGMPAAATESPALATPTAMPTSTVAPTQSPTPSATPPPTPAPKTPEPTNSARSAAALPGGSGCPGKVRRVEDLTSVPAKRRAACFGSVELTLVVFAPVADVDVGGCPPDPALEPGDCSAEPPWLVAPYWVIAGDAAGDALAPNALVAAIDPVSGARRPDDPTWVRVIGHFDDPAATTCRITIDATGSLAEPRKTTIARCRSTFVATSIEPA